MLCPLPGPALRLEYLIHGSWFGGPLVGSAQYVGDGSHDRRESNAAVELAKEAGTKGGCLTAVYNAANEEAAEAFLKGRIRFPAIVRTIAEVLRAADQWAAEPATVEDVLDAQRWARERAKRAVSREVVTTK